MCSRVDDASLILSPAHARILPARAPAQVRLMCSSSSSKKEAPLPPVPTPPSKKKKLPARNKEKDKDKETPASPQVINIISAFVFTMCCYLYTRNTCIVCFL